MMVSRVPLNVKSCLKYEGGIKYEIYGLQVEKTTNCCTAQKLSSFSASLLCLRLDFLIHLLISSYITLIYIMKLLTTARRVAASVPRAVARSEARYLCVAPAELDQAEIAEDLGSVLAREIAYEAVCVHLLKLA